MICPKCKEDVSYFTDMIQIKENGVKISICLNCFKKINNHMAIQVNQTELLYISPTEIKK
jgi:protein-arginine kinase activator protein McsA